MVADARQVGPSKHVTIKEVVHVKTTTGDKLLAAISGKEETIVMNIGNENKFKEIVAGMRGSLSVGAKAGGGVSQPRVIFFKANKARFVPFPSFHFRRRFRPFSVHHPPSLVAVKPPCLDFPHLFKAFPPPPTKKTNRRNHPRRARTK